MASATASAEAEVSDRRPAHATEAVMGTFERLRMDDTA